MTESFQSGGKTIRMEVLEPTSTKPLPAILLLHGAGGNTGFWLDRLFPALQQLGVALFAPHYFDRTGTGRADLVTMTDGIHAPLWLDTIRSARDAIAARPGIDPNRIALVGISLGGFLSLGIAAQNSASPDPAIRKAIRCVVDVSGGLVDSDAALATRHFPPTLILHGDADDVVAPSHARKLAALLTQLGVPHQLNILPGEGHWFSAPAQMQLLMAVAGFLETYL